MRCVALHLLLLVACGGGNDGAATVDAGADVGPDAVDAQAPLGMPGDVTRTMPAHPARLYDVHIPTGYDGVTPLPVIVNLHGGGGNRNVAHVTSCPDGDVDSPECMRALADTRGFIVVSPDGTAGPLGNFRTFNGGGGTDGWQCVSGYACNQQIDEAAYFTALLDDLAQVVHYRADRVFVTGFSNGAALAHRLVCELPEKFAGAAPVSGGNQFATTKPCTTPKPVLMIHGTADPCWPLAGGAVSCADTNPGDKVSIPTTVSGWVTRNGCEADPTDTDLPDTTADGTTTIVHTYACPAGRAVQFYEVTGGGHQWPNGNPGNNGPRATDFSANRVIFDFFAGL